MSKSTILILFAALCLGSSLLAQGSGSAAPPPGGEGESPFTVTKVAKGKVLKAAEDEIVVEADGEERSFKIADATVIKAEKRADVPDRKNVTAADLKQGQPVRVKYRMADYMALEVKILNAKS